MTPSVIFIKVCVIVMCICSSAKSMAAEPITKEMWIENSNLPSKISQESNLKKISSYEDTNTLPDEFKRLMIAPERFEYYYVIGKTQSSGGYEFEIARDKNNYKVCLRPPKPMTAVTTAMTTPIALITVPMKAKVSPVITQCK